MQQVILRFSTDDGEEYPVWTESLLEDICESISNGYTYKADGIRTHKYKITRIESISTGVINIQKLGSVDNIDVRYRLLDGDILFSHINSLEYIGNVALYTENLGEIYHGMNLLCIRPKKAAIIPYFLLIVLRNKGTKKWIQNNAKRAVSQCSLPASDLGMLRLKIPCIDEQRKIADFFSAIDSIISASEAEVTALEKQKKGVMQKIFSQEVRFTPEGGVEYPAWEERRLKDLCEIITGGGTPKTKISQYWEGTIPWISSSDLKENNICDLSITRKITEEAIENSATKKVPRGTVLIVSRVGVGKVAVAPCELCTSQDFTNIVDPQGEPYFFGYELIWMMQKKAIQSQGTSIKGIPASEIREYILKVPCLEEQKKIAEFLLGFDEAISLARQELDKWKLLKKGLMQQMFV